MRSSKHESSKTKIHDARVETILLQNWDPIGIADVEVVLDEYRAYASVIAGMVARGASRAMLVQALVRFERDNLGLSGDVERAERVAERLVAGVSRCER